LKMIKARAAKQSALSAATSRRRCLVLAACPGTRIFVLAPQMCRRPERALPLGVPNAPNKQLIMRQRGKFCKLISRRVESECAAKNCGDRMADFNAERGVDAGREVCGTRMRPRAEIIYGGTGWRSLRRLRGILVPRVPPSCRKRSLSSPAAPDLDMQ